MLFVGCLATDAHVIDPRLWPLLAQIYTAHRICTEIPCSFSFDKIRREKSQWQTMAKQATDLHTNGHEMKMKTTTNTEENQ
jgi:hypothetical protein